jgi:hypothetical protein
MEEILIVQRQHWHSLMMIRHFSINTATTTAAVQSDDHRLHCTTRSDSPLTVALARKYQVSVVCCHMLPGSWAKYHLLAPMESRRRDIWDVPRRRSQGDLCRVREQARKKDHCAQSTVQEKQRSGILVRTCWNELEPRRAWTTSFGEHVAAHPPTILAVTAPKNRCRQVLSRVQKVSRGLLEDHEQYHTRHWWKIFAAGLVRVLRAGFICPNMVVMAVDNALE